MLKDSPLPLNFSPEEEKLGQETLQKLGIPKNANFVCFSNRESAYLKKAYPHTNWDYHDYRDSNIKNYIPAMEEMVRQGYYVLRMGSVVKEPLEINNPRIIDYAWSLERNEFMERISRFSSSPLVNENYINITLFSYIYSSNIVLL